MLGLVSKTLLLSEWTAGPCSRKFDYEPAPGPWCGAFRVVCGFHRAQKLYFVSGARAGLYFLGFFCTYSRPPPRTTPVATPLLVRALRPA